MHLSPLSWGLKPNTYTKNSYPEKYLLPWRLNSTSEATVQAWAPKSPRWINSISGATAQAWAPKSARGKLNHVTVLGGQVFLEGTRSWGLSLHDWVDGEAWCLCLPFCLLSIEDVVFRPDHIQHLVLDFFCSWTVQPPETEQEMNLCYLQTILPLIFWYNITTRKTFIEHLLCHAIWW